jgi:hypothetical protein
MLLQAFDSLAFGVRHWSAVVAAWGLLAACCGSAEGQQPAAPPSQLPNASAVAEAPAGEGTYECNFRNGRFDAETLVPTGYDSPYSLNFIRPERQGLRVLIPASQGRTRPKVGVFAALKLEGDFEITAAFDLVAADAPDVGLGVGANLYIMAEQSLNGATLRRCISPDGQDVFFVHRALRQADGRRQVETDYFPAHSHEGQLRLARQGTSLKYLVADGEEPVFREIKSIEYGANPVALIQLQATTDGASKNVETYWRSLSIRADKLTRIDIPLLHRPPAR